jgi:benzoate/toluate 1,2-dioxygenase subunit alpha
MAKAMRWNDLSRGATHWIEGADEAAQAIDESGQLATGGARSSTEGGSLQSMARSG